MNFALPIITATLCLLLAIRSLRSRGISLKENLGMALVWLLIIVVTTLLTNAFAVMRGLQGFFNLT